VQTRWGDRQRQQLPGKLCGSAMLILQPCSFSLAQGIHLNLNTRGLARTPDSRKVTTGPRLGFIELRENGVCVPATQSTVHSHQLRCSACVLDRQLL
jgi:hypothetical protein